MTRRVPQILTAGLAAFLFASGSLWAGPVFSARTVRVLDGDTLSAKTGVGGEMKIRLYGIDAPEDGQPYSRKAAARLRALTEGRVVQIERMGSDKYGRVVGIVTLVNGKSVNQALVHSGLAWVDPRFCKRESPCRQYQAAERQARKARRGLWRGQNPVPPWEWRRERRQ